MTSEKNLSIAHAWFEAFNSHNLDKLLSLYDDEASHYSPKLKVAHPETNGFIEGKLALQNWWKEAFTNLPTLQYKVSSLTANTDRVFMEYDRIVENQSTMQIAEVLYIRDGKIMASRVYHS
ncbi:MAG: nuclear transport factor 2 family protein [Flavobacterium sp.]|nr:nuclear transport factor 2 family protein [Flavobacterium sp.]